MHGIRKNGNRFDATVLLPAAASRCGRFSFLGRRRRPAVRAPLACPGAGVFEQCGTDPLAPVRRQDVDLGDFEGAFGHPVLQPYEADRCTLFQRHPDQAARDRHFQQVGRDRHGRVGRPRAMAAEQLHGRALDRAQRGYLRGHGARDRHRHGLSARSRRRSPGRAGSCRSTA